MPRDAFVLKIQRELCHPKYARKVSGLLRNRPLVTKVESCVALAPVFFSVANLVTNFHVLGPVSQKSREVCGPEKPFVKVRPAYSVKLVFSYVVKGIKK